MVDVLLKTYVIDYCFSLIFDGIVRQFSDIKVCVMLVKKQNFYFAVCGPNLHYEYDDECMIVSRFNFKMKFFPSEMRVVMIPDDSNRKIWVHDSIMGDVHRFECNYRDVIDKCISIIRSDIGSSGDYVVRKKLRLDDD